MRRKIQPTNPFFGEPRFAFGYEFIREGARLLDYGCFDARFGALLLAHKPVDYYGVDKNADVLKKVDGLRVMAIDKVLPFEDNYFDVVTVFEVLEHVFDQAAVLRELRRVLKPDGLLIMSVPKLNVFTPLDTGNFKFVFPRLHRLYYTLKYSEHDYLNRYLNNPNGLVGDIEKGKSWHQHFREEELTGLLLASGFQVAELDGSGLFSGVFGIVQVLFRPLGRIFSQSFQTWDNYRFSSRTWLCVAQKSPSTGVQAAESAVSV